MATSDSELARAEDIWRKLEYEVKTFGDTCTIKCKLPDGFTMREYNYVFDLTTAKELGMQPQEYILYEQSRLRDQLIARIRQDLTNRYLT